MRRAVGKLPALHSVISGVRALPEEGAQEQGGHAKRQQGPACIFRTTQASMLLPDS